MQIAFLVENLYMIAIYYVIGALNSLGFMQTVWQTFSGLLFI